MRKEKIDILLGKYYNGLCSEEEEKELKAFFTGNDVPSGYETERALFGYYVASKDIPAPSDHFEDKIIIALEKIPERKSFLTRRLLIAVSGIAAGLLILTGTWFFLSRNAHADTFSDPEIAYAETVKVLYNISAKMNSAALEPVAKLNVSEIEGIKVLSRSRETLEKNLENMEFIQKVIGITDISEKEKQ